MQTENKNKMTYKIFVFSIMLIVAIPLQSQDNSKAILETGTVEKQFDYAINETERFKEYQLVNRRWLRKMKVQVLDTLKGVRAELKTTQDRVAAQQKEIEDLKTELGGTNDNLATITNEKNSISIFGQNIKKGTYNAIMWSIIAGLLGFLLLFIFRFNRSHGIIKKTQEALDRTRNEFDGFRERTLKKEQKIMRQLQDEVNKNSA